MPSGLGLSDGAVDCLLVGRGSAREVSPTGESEASLLARIERQASMIEELKRERAVLTARTAELEAVIKAHSRPCDNMPPFRSRRRLEQKSVAITSVADSNYFTRRRVSRKRGFKLFGDVHLKRKHSQSGIVCQMIFRKWGHYVQVATKHPGAIYVNKFFNSLPEILCPSFLQ